MDAFKDGIVVIDKPQGITSHDVVARARKHFNTKKVGHAGTLDPMATGVLVLGIGKATRLLGHLSKTNKTYEATIRLGESTTTDDADGEITKKINTKDASKTEIEAALTKQLGTIMQVPSSVSAIKVDGKRAYKRVREGEDVQLEPREVTIEEIVITNVTQNEDTIDVDVTVTCSSGTYIRAIARDLGNELNLGGHLTKLRRTSVGEYTEEQATAIDDAKVISMREAANAFPQWHVDEHTKQDIKHGKPVIPDTEVRGTIAAVTDTEFVALIDTASNPPQYLAVFAS